MIHGISPARVTPVLTPEQSAPAAPVPGDAFASLLGRGLTSVSASEQEAQTMIGRALAGDDISSAEVFTAVKKADLSLRMMLQVRNSLMNAFDEIQKMQF